MLWTKCDKRYAGARTHEGVAPACDMLDIMVSECRSLAHEPAACTTVENERRERARRARACLPRLIESKNGHDRRGGSRERACAGVRRFGQSSSPALPGRANLADTCGSTLSRCSLLLRWGTPTPHFHPAAIRGETPDPPRSVPLRALTLSDDLV